MNMKNSTHLELNANHLKIIAAITMFIDHLGYFLFPSITLFRVIGRVSYPIFAFFIAEGCIHTNNMKKYFGRISILGSICMVVTYLAEGILYGNILITFSFSILIITIMEKILVYEKMITDLLLNILLLSICIVFAILTFQYIEIDYGVLGIIVPVLCWIFLRINKKMGLLALAVGLILLSIVMGGYQIYCMLSLVLLQVYNGRRGQVSLSRFFYLFYPLHIAAIEAVAMIMDRV